MYGNRTHWELCSNPPMVLKTMANTSCANTPENRFLLTSNIVDHPGKYGFIKVIQSNRVTEKSRLLKCL